MMVRQVAVGYNNKSQYLEPAVTQEGEEGCAFQIRRCVTQYEGIGYGNGFLFFV